MEFSNYTNEKSTYILQVKPLENLQFIMSL